MHREFYLFEKVLVEALEKEGYQVTVASDVYPSRIMGQLLGKLFISIAYKFTYSYIVKNYLQNRYSLGLIIRGRGISSNLIHKMKESIPCVIGYNWDTFSFNKSPLKWLKYVDKYYTFDYEDAMRHNIPVLELFSAIPKALGQKYIKYNLAAIGKNYPGRLKYIDKVFSILKPESSFLHLHENNIFHMILNFIKNPVMYIKYWNYINLKPLTYNDYVEAISSAEFIVDYSNQGQAGITMRCFETISLQTKIITNNAFIFRSRYFSSENTVLFNLENETKILRTHVMFTRAPHISSVRTIRDFVTELIA